jgi:mannose-6-phosphate isomerase-like protein (cupin superfamily)
MVEMKIRRVVTGNTSEGKSVFVSDEELEPIAPNFHRLWAADELPFFPTDGVEPFEKGMTRGFFPAAPGGVRFWVFSLPPETDGPARVNPEDLSRYSPEVEAQLSGKEKVMDPDIPGMHTTDTVDFQIVISGEATLELDDGAERTVRPGEVIIQNGTRHRWHNRGSEPAVLAALLLGGTRAK